MQPQPRKPGLRGPINKKCRECIFDKAGSGTWRQQVQLCTGFTCPLWPVRPVSSEPLPESTKKVLPGELAQLFDHLDTQPHVRPDLNQKTAKTGQPQPNSAALLESPRDAIAGMAQ